MRTPRIPQIQNVALPALRRMWWTRVDQQRLSPTHGRVARDILNRAQKDQPSPVEYNLIAGEGAFLPVLYGKVRVSPILFRIGSASGGVYGPQLIMGAIWGAGEVNRIDVISATGAPITLTNFATTDYTGTTGQTSDNDLVQIDPDWNNDMVFSVGGSSMGIAYSVIKVDGSSGFAMPLPIGEIEGRKVYDPRTATTAYSDNPALCLADFLADPIIGAGRDIDWASVEDAADACDEALVDASKRRRISLAMIKRLPVEQWIEILRSYAGCYVSMAGNTATLIPDRPTTSVVTLTDADYSMIGGNHSLRFQILSRSQVPTVVTVKYTDQRQPVDPNAWGTGGGWRYDQVSVYADGVLAGTKEWREQVIDMPGIPTYEQARREAVERLNSGTLEDLLATWETVDEGIKFQIGDVVTLGSTTRALVSKDFRITRISNVGSQFGKWKIEAQEYQSGTYSDDVTNPDDLPDVGFYDPSDPPTVTTLTATEEVYQLQTGIYASRIKLTWDDPEWPHVRHFDVELWIGSTLIHSGVTSGLVYRSPAIKEGSTYTCKVRVVSSIGTEGTYATTTLAAAGKYLNPGDVPALRGIELGGEVRLSWDAATDLDIWRYELRYGTTGGSWDTATFVDRVDGLRKVTKDIPEGTWRFYCKALDSVGNYSDNAATVDLDVTIDRNILASEEVLDAPVTTTNFASFTLGRLDTATLRYATDAGTVMSSLFTDPTMAGYTDPLQTYHGAGACVWESETWDLGYLITGQWQAATGVTEISGAAIETMKLSENGVDWDDYTSLKAKVPARYAKLRIEGDDSGDTMMVTVPNSKLTLQAVTRDESGSSTSTSSGAKTITVESAYASVASITVTPLGTSGLAAVVDNVTVGDPTTFDVYIFDSTWTQVAASFYWTLKGI